MTGGVLIVVGIIFLAEELRIVPHVNMGTLWPLIPMAIGCGQLLLADDESRRRHGRFPGLWLILVGGVFLLHNFHVMSLRQSWPLFIVAAGIGILFSSRRDVPEPPAPQPPSPEGKA